MHAHAIESMLRAASPATAERARRILQRRWLRDVRHDGAQASATCHGLVGVRIRVDLARGAARCDCGPAQPCEHALALLLHLADAPAHAPAAPAPAATSAPAYAPHAGAPGYVCCPAHDAPDRILLMGTGGLTVPEPALESLRWVWWRRDSPHVASGERRTLAQALQLLHQHGVHAQGVQRDATLCTAGALFHQRALGDAVHVQLLDAGSDASLALARLLAQAGARPFPGQMPPASWTLPDDEAFARWWLDASLRGARLVPDASLNPKPLKGVRVLLDAACLPARLQMADASEPLAHPEMRALLARALPDEPRVESETQHLLVPATRVVDVEEALRAAGADIEYRRLAPAGRRYLEWPEELPEDLHGARPRLRAPYRGALDEEPPGLRAGVVLAEYQREAVAFILHHGHTCLLADDMGLGKTLESLAAAQFVRGRVLVVCPASARDVWRREVATFTHEESIVVGPGDDPAPALASGAKYVITGYSNLEALGARLSPDDFAMVILDESHYVKNIATGRARLVRERLLGIPRRLVVSGTPVMNAPEEMRGQLLFLHPHEWSDGAWFERRFVEPFREGSEEVRDAVLKRLRQFLEGVMIRREKATALPDLPPKTLRWHRVHLPAEAARAYAEHEAEFTRFVREEGVESLGSAKASGKLERLKQAALAAKMRDALAFTRALLEKGEKVVVFSRYRNALRSVERELAAYGPVVLTGDTGAQQRTEAARRFQEDESCRVFLGQLVAAGTALTLTRGTHAVFLDLDWNPANHRQAMDRIHRRGQTRPVEVHFFLAVGTVDEDVAEALEEKGRMMDALLSPTHGGRADLRSVRRVVGERVLARQEGRSPP